MSDFDATLETLDLHNQAQSMMVALGTHLVSHLRGEANSPANQALVAKSLLALDNILARFPEWDPNRLNERGPAWLEVALSWKIDSKITVQMSQTLSDSPTLQTALNRWTRLYPQAMFQASAGHLEEWPWMALIAAGKINPTATWEHKPGEQTTALAILTKDRSDMQRGIFKALLDAPLAFSASELDALRADQRGLLHLYVNDDEVRTWLIEKGMDVNHASSSLSSPLFYARTPIALETLYHHGADLWKRNHEHELYDASMSRRGLRTWKENAQGLIKRWKELRGPAPHGEQEESNEALLLALRYGNFEVAQELGLQSVLQEGKPIHHRQQSFGVLGALCEGYLKNSPGWNTFDGVLHHKTPVAVFNEVSGTNTWPDIVSLKLMTFDVRGRPSGGFEEKMRKALKRWESNEEKRAQRLLDGVLSSMDAHQKATPVTKSSAWFEQAWNYVIELTSSLPLDSRLQVWHELHAFTHQRIQVPSDTTLSTLFSISGELSRLIPTLTAKADIQALVPTVLLFLQHANWKYQGHPAKWEPWLVTAGQHHYLPPLSSLPVAQQKALEKYPTVLAYFEQQQLTESLGDARLDTASPKSKFRL